MATSEQDAHHSRRGRPQDPSEAQHSASWLRSVGVEVPLHHDTSDSSAYGANRPGLCHVGRSGPDRRAGAIHLHLWASGYRNIPTIGPLFLAQTIAAALVAVVLAATRRLVTAVLGALFLVATAGGLFVSATVGLFGFRDGLDAPWAGASLVIEGAGIAVLTVTSVALAWSARSRYSAR